MKKKLSRINLIILSIVILLISFYGCGQLSDNDDEQQEEEVLLTVDEILETYSESSLKCDKYDLHKYTSPIWKSQIIYNESVMFVRGEDGSVPVKNLTYPIAKILEVRNNTLEILYEEGMDYTVTEDGSFKLTENSRIPVWERNQYYLDQMESQPFKSKSTGKYLKYGEGTTFTSMQTFITYIRTTKYDGPVQKFEPEKLPKTLEKLKNKSNLKIVFFGDSVMEGCNSSLFNGVAPRMPTFDQMLINRLKEHYGYGANTGYIERINNAVGGWSTENGKGTLESRVIKYNPDLVVIHFGINDASASMPDETFGGNIQFMVNKILNNNPDCEIILIAPALCNPDACLESGQEFLNNAAGYQYVLEDIAGGYEFGVVCANMTAMDQFIKRRKTYMDLTSNNINHPNDFIISVYAQVLLSKLIENYS